MKKNFLKILKTFAVFVKDPVRIKKKKTTSYRLVEKYLQPTYLKNNSYLKYIENIQNSTIKKQTFQLENWHKI